MGMLEKNFEKKKKQPLNRTISGIGAIKDFPNDFFCILLRNFLVQKNAAGNSIFLIFLRLYILLL